MKKLTTSEIITKAKMVHGDKYDYSLVDYKAMRFKIKIICPIHGVWEQKVDNHIYGTKGCPQCASNFQDTVETFITKSNNKHANKYDYSLVDYVDSKTKVKIICKTHGIFEQAPSNHIYGQGCPYCYGNVQYTTESYIDVVSKIHDNKYDYSLVDYNGKEEKIKIICPIHGIWEQKAGNHKNGQGCPKCRGDRIAKSKTFIDEEYLLKEYKRIHGDIYDYSKFVFYGRRDERKSIIICPTHGEYEQNAFNHLNGQGCPHCGFRYSSQEEIVERFLKSYNIRYNRSDRTKIKPYELDFYIPKYKVAIECNGTYWHSELRGKDRNYHLNKTKLCEEGGIRLVHINEYEFANSKFVVISKLKSILSHGKKSIHGRKCEVREIDTPTKSKFLNKYHLQGNDKASVKLGLFYKNRLVSVMTFCKRRVALGKKSTEEGEYELSRYCGNFNFYVIGGASKLLKYFERNYKPKKIITYADKRWSCGDLYFKLGFNHTHDSKPNYWYFHKSDMTKLYHRFNFRKNVLPKKLDKFDPKKTEWQNMQDNGWNRIWDCGTMVFEKTY